MAAPLKAGLAPDMVIGQGYIVRLTALDAASGAVVAGVVVSQASVFATHLSGPLDGITPTPLIQPSEALV